MDRFRAFCEAFANFPTLQKDLSLLDKPATNGESLRLDGRKSTRTNEFQAPCHPEVHHHLDLQICHPLDVQWAHQENAVMAHHGALQEVKLAHQRDRSIDDEHRKHQ